MVETVINNDIQTAYTHSSLGDTYSSLFSAQQRAFTLAETLITLVIVGIVAAVTVPAMINKTNDSEYVTAI